MSDLLEVEYREYTTDGRLITTNQFTTHVGMLADDVSIIICDDVDICMERHYINTGEMTVDESLKPLWRTNIIVRDYKTGRFQKWAHLLDS